MTTRFPQRILLALRSFVRHGTAERELDLELQFHLEQMAAHETTRGASNEEANLRARRRFGGFNHGFNQVKEACRDMRTLRPVEHFLQDLRFGARLLWRGPVFALVAVLSLALGIGANSAIFSVINAIVLRPLPVEAANELFIAEAVSPDGVSPRFSYPLVGAASSLLGGRAEVCAQSTIQPMLIAAIHSGPSSPAPAAGRVQLLSGDCFAMLRQRPQLGRLLGPSDNVTRGGHPVVVISDGYWSRRFARSPSAVGTEIVINGTAMTIVGVTAPDFFGMEVETRGADAWAPVMMQSELRYSGNLSNANGDPNKPWVEQSELSWLNLMLRVPKTHAGTAAGVAAALNVALQQDFAAMSGYDTDAEFRERLRGVQATLRPGARGFSDLRNRLAKPLLVLLAMVGLVLAVACANLASLLLARATHRQREVAIRLSMGAGRGRLVRQLFTESLLLALLGGVGGLVAAIWGSAALVRFGESDGASFGINVTPDGHVLLFTLAVSIVTGLLFGLLPAFRATDLRLADTLKAQARAVAGGARSGASWSRRLIAGQMAFSLLLLVVASLFGRNLRQMMRVDVGFDRQHLLVAQLDARSAGYESKDLPSLERRLLERVLAVPGVEAASMSANGPFSGSRSTSGFEAQGYTHPREERLRTREEVVTPGYFRTVGLKILRGRGFLPEDVAEGRKVTVVNQTFARRYFAGRDPLGQRWSYDTDFGPDAFEIVGVVADAHYDDVKGDSPNMAYRPAAQTDWYLDSLEVRTSRDPAALVSTVRAAFRDTEPRLPIDRIDTLDERVSRSMGQERMMTWLTGVFGAVALALACLGLYGTVSHAVTRRTAELGIRMALGADHAAVRWMILREALLVVVRGLAVGLPLAFFGARALRSVLQGVDAFDLPSYGLAIVALVAIATLAAYFPARRASRLDPATALRAD
ncbi:MAG: ABC transporter permease [Acidobacteriota bacterium]